MMLFSLANMLAVTCLLTLVVGSLSRLTESERAQHYHERGYHWPLNQEDFVPPTKGWSDLMHQRLEQVHEIQDWQQRYEGYMQTMNHALVAPNFTEHGFGLTRAPDDLMAALRAGIHDGLANGDARLEYDVDVIDGPRCLFIDRPDLMQRALKELHPLVEAWAGVELTPYTAYGFRLYQNESALWMHVDKMQTHIVSFILHIDKSEDAEPWPIFIEDFQGKTHEVILTSGDMLFYESSKCMHGRPRRFNGSWYSSIFVHYYPTNGWIETNHELETHYSIPPSWQDGLKKPGEEIPKRNYPEMEMVGTSFREPSCPDDWCATQNTIKWSGPGELGVWLDPAFQKHPLEVPGLRGEEL